MRVPEIDPRFWSYLPFILLTVALLIGVPLAFRVWRDLHADDEPAPASELFSDLERAYAEGKMTEAEFRRIREKLIGLPAKRVEKISTVPHRTEQVHTPETAVQPQVPDETEGPFPSPDPHPEM
jgi:hypothetical protein